MVFFGFWRGIWRRLRGKSILWISLLSLAVLVASAGLVSYAEGLTLKDSIWWAVVTMTTVGYGDISPGSFGGRVVAVGLMVSGIGLLSVLTATVATQLIEHKSKRDRGVKKVREKGHILVCGWNHTAVDVLENLKADRRSVPIVLLANLDRRPIEDEGIGFVQGEVTKETMDLANAAQAECAVVLGDESIVDSHSRDAKTLISALTIKDYNSNIYVCIQLVEKDSLPHAAISKANEVIVSGDLTGGLLSRAALDHGTSRVISHLVRTNVMGEFYRVVLPSEWEGLTFSDCLIEAKQKHDILITAVESKTGWLTINPAFDYRMEAGDTLVVISKERPAI